MPQTYRGRPQSASRVVLPDGRAAVLIPREQTHFSKLRNGYPLVEEYLSHLASDNVDDIAIDDGERIYVFSLYQYRTGNRVGHEPYPMKRVATLDDARRSLTGDERDSVRQAAEWEWLTDADLRPARDRSDWADASNSFTQKGRDESVLSD